MNTDDIYVRNFDGTLVPLKENGNYKKYEGCVFCGFYAALAVWGEDNAGDLFAVFSTPILVPAYNKNGKRINVGKEKAGMTYTEGRGWYNE